MKKYIILMAFAIFTTLGVLAHQYDLTVGKTQLIVTLSNDLKLDTLELVILEDNYLNFEFTKKISAKRISAVPNKGSYRFVFELKDGPKYFLLKKKSDLVQEGVLLKRNIIEAGDSVHIDLNDRKITFNGYGCNKMMAVYQFEKEYHTSLDSIRKNIIAPTFVRKEMEYAYRMLRQANELVSYWKGFLDQNKSLYSTPAYQLLLADFVGAIQQSALYGIVIKIGLNKSFNSSEIGEINGYVKQYLSTFEAYLPEAILAKSENWMLFAQVQGQYQNYLPNKKSSYDFYKNNFNGRFREKLLLDFLFKAQLKIKNIDSLFGDARQLTKDPYYLDIIDTFLNSQGIGRPAPAFSLVAKNGKRVDLAEFKGKVVFLDFWFIGCSPCIGYFKSAIHPAEERLNADSKIVFISVCIEKDEKKWKEALLEGSYTSKTAVNLYTGSLGWSHPIVKAYAVFGAPKPMIIDENGNIYTTDPTLLGRKNNPEQLLDTLRRLIR